MPELPEIEAFKACLEEHCLHKTITNVHVFLPKMVQNITPATLAKAVVHHVFTKVTRHGKYLVISLTPSDQRVVLHFGMTGSVFYAPRDQDQKEKVRFSAVQITFADGSSIHYKSVRTFEKLWLCDKNSLPAGIANLGPDALQLSFTDFKAILTTRGTRNIKALLMDQHVIAGIGNEYSDEILFQAGINPNHTAKDLSPTQVKKLYTQMHKVLTFTVKLMKKNLLTHKTDILTQQNKTTFPATYLQAHRHRDMICPKNKQHHLKKATIAGRTSYYCPHHQRV